MNVRVESQQAWQQLQQTDPALAARVLKVLENTRFADMGALMLQYAVDIAGVDPADSRLLGINTETVAVGIGLYENLPLALEQIASENLDLATEIVRLEGLIKIGKAEYTHLNHNRFLILDLRAVQPEISQRTLLALSKKLDSLTEIDDVLVIQHDTKGSIWMRVMGTDGTEADFCGNGFLACVDKLARQKVLANRFVLSSGLDAVTAMPGQFTDNSGVALNITVGNEQDHAAIQLNTTALQHIAAHGASYLGAARTGEPHVVIQAPESWQANPPTISEINEFARVIRENSNIPGAGVNVNFVLAQQDNAIQVVTVERGARRVTMACGSGVTAVSIVMNRLYGDRLFGDSPIRTFQLSSPGGTHVVNYDVTADQWQLAPGAGEVTLDLPNKL